MECILFGAAQRLPERPVTSIARRGAAWSDGLRAAVLCANDFFEIEAIEASPSGDAAPMECVTDHAPVVLMLVRGEAVMESEGHRPVHLRAGDTVLRAVSKVLKQSVRTSDMVIRYGGEEFLIILQDAEGDHADQVAENIRAAMEAVKTNVGNVVIQKTISIGISDFPTDSDTFWQAVKYADVALYRAKEEGRNRVVRFNTTMWSDGKEY